MTKPSRLARAALAGTAAAALIGLAACGAGDGASGSGDSTTINGQYDSAASFDPNCSNHSGESVTIEDAAGNRLGTTTLGDGNSDAGSCTYSFTTAVNLSADSYIILLGNSQSGPSFTKAQMEAGPKF